MTTTTSQPDFPLFLTPIISIHEWTLIDVPCVCVNKWGIWATFKVKKGGNAKRYFGETIFSVWKLLPKCFFALRPNKGGRGSVKNDDDDDKVGFRCSSSIPKKQTMESESGIHGVSITHLLYSSHTYSPPLISLFNALEKMTNLITSLDQLYCCYSHHRHHHHRQQIICQIFF